MSIEVGYQPEPIPAAGGKAATLYIRWQRDRPRVVKVMRIDQRGPVPCGVCDVEIRPQQTMVLYALGPDSPVDAVSHDAGRWYSAVAILVHPEHLDRETLAAPDVAQEHVLLLGCGCWHTEMWPPVVIESAPRVCSNPRHREHRYPAAITSLPPRLPDRGLTFPLADSEPIRGGEDSCG
jgi:hypothetical protein